MTPQPTDLAATEALLAFWRDAGIDSCYLDEPLDRTIFVAPSAPASVLRTVINTGSSLGHGGGQIPLAERVAQARRLAATAVTLQDLAKAADQFQASPLRALGPRHTVFGRGNPEGQLLVIGQAPGETEDQTGQAFSGPAGQMLDRILAAGGLADTAYLTNTVFWRPPGDRVPTREELASSAPFLHRAVEIMRPRAVLLIGDTATKAILDTEESLIKLRGQWHDWSVGDTGLTVPVMTTFHPGFLLLQPQAKRAVWTDILALTTIF